MAIRPLSVTGYRRFRSATYRHEWGTLPRCWVGLMVWSSQLRAARQSRIPDASERVAVHELCGFSACADRSRPADGRYPEATLRDVPPVDRGAAASRHSEVGAASAGRGDRFRPPQAL